MFDLVTVAGSLIELLYEQVISPLLSTPSTDIKTTGPNINPYADRLYDNKNKVSGPPLPQRFKPCNELC